MIIWVKKEAVGAACDQRAEVIGIKTGFIVIKLCGTQEDALIAPNEICGLEIGDLFNNINIMFNISGSARCQIKK